MQTYCPAARQAFYGAADHLDGLEVPEQFKGTEIETPRDTARKRMLAPAGFMDKEDAQEVVRVLIKLPAIDRGTGIPIRSGDFN